MGGALLILIFIIILTQANYRSSYFRACYSQLFWLLFVSFVYLGWMGQMPVDDPWIGIGQFWTFIYFSIFLSLPFIDNLDK